MKKNIIKLISLVLTLALVLGSVVGCSSNEPAANADPDDSAATDETMAQRADEFVSVEDPAESKYPTAEELKANAPKIGCLHYDFTDTLGANFKKVATYFAQEFGCEIEYITTGLTAEASIEGVQNAIELGCDIIMTGSETPEVFQMCKDAGVIQMYTCNTIKSDSLKEFIQDYDKFAGIVCEDDYQSAYNAVATLAEEGCTNIGMMTCTPGFLDLIDNRTRAALQAIEDLGLNLVVDYYANPMNMAYGETLSQWLTLYPEMDGVIALGSDGSLTSAAYAEGAQDRIKIAQFDIVSGTDQAIKDGLVVWCATGQANSLFVSLILAYNLWMGDDLLEDNTQVLLRPFLEIKGPESYNNYIKYAEGEIPYFTGEELKSYIKAWNPDITIDDILELNANYTIEDVTTRHADLFE